MTTTNHLMTNRRIDSNRKGGAKPAVILTIVILIVSVLAIWMVVIDGRTEENQIDQSPPTGSVEGNLAKLAAWAAEPIFVTIESTGKLPDDAQGTELLKKLADKARPTFYPPTPASPDGNPRYRNTNNGFDIIFPGRDGKPVVCSFSAQGAYEGATGEEAANEENDNVNDPLTGGQ